MYEKTEKSKKKPLIIVGILAVVVVVMVLIFAFGGNNGEMIAETEPTPTPEPRIILTHEQYMEDLDYLFDTLRNSFPLFNFIDRTLNTDSEEIITNTRDFMETATILTDTHFLGHLNNQFFRNFEDSGHLFMYDENSYHFALWSFEEDPENSEDALPWIEKLNNPASRRFYGEISGFLRNFLEQENAFINSTNVSTQILEEGRIARVNITGFNFFNMELDSEILMDFFAEISDYEHLIIDIRGAAGGTRAYFLDLIMAPLIQEPLTYSYYRFTMDSELNRFFFESSWYDDEGEPNYQRIRDNTGGLDAVLAEMPYLNVNDLELFDLRFFVENTINPAEENIDFNGHIWILTDGMNSFAAEFAAFVSKQTGFAALVGETTGGGGIGTESLLVALPNTGIIVGFSSTYGTDPEGRNSQEFPVTPHHFNRDGMSAIETVLALIEEGAY
ncbi:MAG: S41 family peptidase [Defluviitaleaceae bacterium]|nr:S41 family peptidase [Defluviitaleaceae bacterium]